MAVPVVVGSTALHSSGTANPWLSLSSINDGSWMVITVMALSTTTITAPAGWTILDTGTTSGTRRSYVYAKIKTSGDGTAVTFTQSDTSQASYGIVWGTGGVDPTAWFVGTPWIRNTSTQPSGARYDTIAKSVTTINADTLVLALSNEATNALVQSTEVTNVSPSGWTQQLYLAQPAANDRIETLWVASKNMSTVGATGDVTITYASPQDSNSMGLQVAIPSSSAAPSQSPIPTIVGSATSVFNSTTSTFNISRPSGVAVGDYIMVVVRGQTGSASTDVSSPGFTRMGPAFTANSVAARLNGFYGRQVADVGTEPTQYNFTFTQTGGAARIIAVAFIIRGVDLTNPVLGYGSVYEGTSIAGGKQVDPFAISSVPGLQLFMGGSEFAANNDHTPVTLPSGFTPVTSFVSGSDITVSRTYLWVGQQEVAASPTSAASITWNAQVAPAAESIVLLGTSVVPASPGGSGTSIIRGNGAAGKLYYMSPSGARTPSAVVPMRRGFATTADALNAYGGTWAHRGGSDSYPEMSLYGYTQSVMRGYGVLEVSLGRTSDGVWFGLHDQTTDRTSGGTYGNASSQTWAQIQAQNIVIGAQGAPQPYMSWKQLVADYGSTHIIVADPKYALGSYRTEFLNMVANDIGVNRAIIKYSGAGGTATALATAAQAMGFQTWGYFYATDASAANGGNGNLQAYGGPWTTIGMEYGASQAIWNEALAFGKPVIGHIAPNQAAYNTAMSKGATAVMVSGAGVVAPVSWWNAMPKFQNLVGAYGFNEGSGGTAADSSFKGNNLTLGTQTGWTVAHSGSGLQTTGTTGAGATNTSFANPTAAITIVGWVYPRTITGEMPLFGFWSSPSSDPAGTAQFALYASRTSAGPAGVLAVGANISSNTVSAGGFAMTANAWQHVAATFDGTTMKLFLNGSQVSSIAQSGTLGVGSFAVLAKTDAMVDDVRVFNAALSAAEITKWMNHSI